MKKLFIGIAYFGCVSFFALAGLSFNPELAGIGMVSGILLGMTVVNFLDMGTKFYQAAYLEKLSKGYVPPEE